jgi:hypothetical protein
LKNKPSKKLSFHSFVKRRIERVEILAVQMLLRDAESFGKAVKVKQFQEK